MKTTETLKYRMFVAVTLLALVSCRNEVECSLVQNVSAEIVVPGRLDTRSMLPSDIEGRIETVTWAAYAMPSGALSCSGYAEPSASGSYRLNLNLPEGKAYDLYVIANAGDLCERVPTSETLVQEFDLLLPEAFADLSSSGLPMAGCALGVQPGGKQVTVPLRSLVAAYDVEVNIKGLDLKVSSNEYRRVMQGEYIKVRNSNRHLVPFGDHGSAARSAGDVSQGDTDASFCAIVPLGESLTQSTDAVFSYTLYVPENLQGVLLPANDDPDRKIPEVVDQVNGPGTSERLTYLEFSFTKTEAADSNPFTGEVIYRMYPGRDNCTDFSIEGGSSNVLSVGFDAASMLGEPFWKVDHGKTWNNEGERLEFSSHDLTVTPASENKLFVWYSGTGISLEEAIPRYMGIRDADRVKAAVRDEWFFEEDSGGEGSMPGFRELWASDPVKRIQSEAIRYVATSADKLKSRDVVGRYYFKAVDSMMGKTAMLVVSDKWHCMRDTCYVHFTGSITMNSQDFNGFRVAQERVLKVDGLPVDSHATCVVRNAAANVVVEETEAGPGTTTKCWKIKAMDAGNVLLHVEAGGVSANFTITVLPVYLGIMRLGKGLYCTLDGAHNTCTYAYYADKECRTELPESSFAPELKEALLAPCLSLEGEYAPLIAVKRGGRQITTCLESYSANGTTFDGCRGELLLGTLSLWPSYSSKSATKAYIYLKPYRTYDPMGKIGTLTDASGYEPRVLAKVPDGLPGEYMTHANFNGYKSFREFSGLSIVDAAGIGKPESWSVGLYASSGKECTSVVIDGFEGDDVWLSGSAAGQCGEQLTARLKVRNMNSGEVFTEDLFKLDCTVFVCIAGAYCNETGLYGKASLYEVPIEDYPHTFYNSVTGAADWHDNMILIQRDEWNTFVSWGGKIKKYLIYADDFIGTPSNVHLGKSKYNLSAGLCFDTYADMMGDYSDKVGNAIAPLFDGSKRFVTGTVENRNSYVEFDSSAATQLVLLKFHPSLYFSLLAYHSSDNRPASDMRKRREVYESQHYDGVDDKLVFLSQTSPYALRTQIQHVFYGDVEDGLCNNQPWRVDFNHRSPSSIKSWYGDPAIHLPFAPEGDSSVDELIGQFAPELTFSRGANISGMTFRDGNAEYVSQDGTHLTLFFLHEVLGYDSDHVRYTWKNWY